MDTIKPAIKYLKVVIPRSERLLAKIRIGLDREIQKELDTPIKSAYDMFLLFNCRCNNYKISPSPS